MACARSPTFAPARATAMPGIPEMGEVWGPANAALEQLTQREREIAVLMAEGLTNAQIGSRLNVSMASVKAHLSHIFTKLGVDNRVSAAMMVREVHT